MRTAYAQWLLALVARFGADAVAEWQAPPARWSFEAWLRGKGLLRHG